MLGGRQLLITMPLSHRFEESVGSRHLSKLSVSLSSYLSVYNSSLPIEVFEYEFSRYYVRFLLFAVSMF